MRDDQVIDKQGTRVEVRGNNIDGALRNLKKLITNEGLLKEMKRMVEYEKPSERRRRRKAEARRRQLKKQAQMKDF